MGFMRVIGRAALGGPALLFCGVLSAGSFQVNPVRVTLSADAPVAALTIRNMEARETVVQLQLRQWSQRDGDDAFTETSALLVTPPIVRVAGGGEQIVRIGLRAQPDAQVEQSYRLFVREVPPPPAPGFQGLQVALQVSLPVFVLPMAPLREDVRWQLGRAPTGSLQLTASNVGTRHLQLLGATLHPEDGPAIARPDMTGYVLPGQAMTWPLETPAPQHGASFRLEARTDAGMVDATLVMPPH